MQPHPSLPSLSVSSLVPSWEPTPADDGGGAFAAAEAATVVEQAVQPQVARPSAVEAAPRQPARPPVLVQQQAAEAAPAPAAEPVLPSAPEPVPPYAHPVVAVPEARALVHTRLLLDEEGLPVVDYDQLERRDIARELLRARLVAIAEQRHHRSAYEIAFILLAVAVAILLVAPPLGHILLAARGIEA